jgi:uncharacterized protein YegP (UPF0339 family)
MATAPKQSPVVAQRARRAPEVRVPPSLEFLITEDNGGDYHWMIAANDGVTLARSGGFATYDDAAQAAQLVRDGAGSAVFERPGARARTVDVRVRRDVASDDSDAERSSDEGGKVTSRSDGKWRPRR